jgi:hypothetical protein
MSFESGAVSLRMFTIPRKFEDGVVERFADQSLPSLDSLREDAIYGWVTGRHLFDRKITEDTAYPAGHLRLTLVKAERKIPSSLLKAEMKQEELVRLQMKEADYVSRKEKAEIRQELVERLLPQMPVQLKGTDFVHNPDELYIYTDAVSEKQADEFIMHLRHASGIAPEPITPEALARARKRVDTRDWYPSSFSPDVEDEFVSGDPGHDFATWLWFRSETVEQFIKTSQGDVSVFIEGPLTFFMEGGGAHESVIRKGNPTVSMEAKASLLAGKKLAKCKLTVTRGEEIWTGNFDASELTVRSMKLPEDEEKLDHMSRFADRLVKIGEFREILFDLFDEFVTVRSDKKAWSALRPTIHEWVKSRKAVP